MFWLLAAALTLVVCLLLLRPLLGAGPAREDAADAAVYADQLHELDADRARGALAEGEYEATRTEIARRLLRARKHAAAPSAASHAGTRLAAALILSVPLAALGLYSVLGSPGEGDQPLAVRQPPEANELARLIAEAEARLAEAPDDGVGWAAIAPAYQSVGRFAEAADAYSRAAAILGESAARVAAEAESLTFAEAGEVTPKAARLFERALTLDPDALRPKLFLAIAARQRGDVQDAAERWRRLIEASEGDEPWLRIAEAEFQRMSGRDGPAGPGGRGDADAADGEAEVAANRAVAEPPVDTILRRRPGDASAALGGPTIDRDDAAEGAASQMVAGMVSRLAARLEADGGSADEWARLVRSYRVLGRPDAARAAAEQALEALPARARETFRTNDDVRAVLP